mmetsp:Transcript_68057/g.138436  ORF Transcript_68057/g.138436 Transcript_68057/m.138436 type:complete len:206 (-) Transcript_68057:1624-2241(-)
MRRRILPRNRIPEGRRNRGPGRRYQEGRRSAASRTHLRHRIHVAQLCGERNQLATSEIPQGALVGQQPMERRKDHLRWFVVVFQRQSTRRRARTDLGHVAARSKGPQNPGVARAEIRILGGGCKHGQTGSRGYTRRKHRHRGPVVSGRIPGNPRQRTILQSPALHQRKMEFEQGPVRALHGTDRQNGRSRLPRALERTPPRRRFV